MTLQFYTTLSPQITTANLLFTDQELVFPSSNRVSKLSLSNLTITQTEDEHKSNITSITNSRGNTIVASLMGEVSVFGPTGRKILEFSVPTNLHDIECSGNFLVAMHENTWSLYYFNLFNNDSIFDGLFLSKPILVYSFNDPSSMYQVKGNFSKSVQFYNDTLFMLPTLDGSVQVFSVNAQMLDDVQVEQWTLSGQGNALVTIAFDDSKVLSQVKDEYDSDEEQKVSIKTIPEGLRIWTFSIEKQLTTWEYSNGRWTIENKANLSHILSPHSADFHFKRNVFVVGVKGGFHLFDLNDLSKVKEDFIFSKLKNHPSLSSVGRDITVSCVKFSNEGDWIALSSFRDHDILIIYDYESKTFVLKQESHRSNVRAIAYSHLGDIIATGDDMGEIKIWDLRTRQCFVTLTSHNGPITSLKFSRPPNSKDIALYSSSLDGTCRAFDLLRYRNFRTFVPPDPVPFTSMATNMSGELLAATGQEEFGIHLWNIVTSQLLDVLKGHLGPITCCSFSPTSDILATGSWDKTVKVWTIHSGQCTTLDHSSEVVSLAFRPDGAQIVVSTADGNLTFWDVLNGELIGVISGSRDIRLEGLAGQERTNVALETQKYYTKVCYTSDGQNVIAGSYNQFLNLYNVDRRALVRQYVICENHSLDGLVTINSLYFVDSQYQIWRTIENKRRGKVLSYKANIPGAEDEQLPRIQCDDLIFNPTNTELAVATPGGVYIFRTEVNRAFQPIEIDPDITKHTIRNTISKNEFGKAFIMAIKLNDTKILEDVFYCISKEDIFFTCRSFPQKFIENLLRFLSLQLEKGNNIEYILIWIQTILQVHGPYIQQLNLSHIHSLTNSNEVISNAGHMAVLRSLLRSLYSNQRHLQSMNEENKHSLKYILSFSKNNKIDSIPEKLKEKKEKREKKENGFKPRKRAKQ